ncbi:hypothetical protein [Burkholderia multivorans]|uniref:hypothetical protein n=1 Tax=Burkholderia multivorans TaxID=87883 RepID=UPI00201116FA|nr:hypothetical protein [Burkholderia multivorans]
MNEQPKNQQPAAAPIDIEARFIAEHGHRLAQLLRIDAFDIADRDAQIMAALKNEHAPSPADERAAFALAMVEAGYHEPEPSPFSEDAFKYQRDQDRYIGFQLGRQSRACSANETGAEGAAVAWMSIDDPRDCISDAKKRDMIEHAGAPGARLAEKYSIALGVITPAQAAEPCAWLVEWTPNVSDKVWVQSFVNELDAINKQLQVGGRIIACAPVDALSRAHAQASFDGNHVENHCPECGQYESECECAQADAREGLTIDRIESLARTHLYVGDDDVVFGTENFARAIERDILATHPGQPEPRECRHCGWMCIPNSTPSTTHYPLPQPEPSGEVTAFTTTVGRLLATAPHFEECETPEPCLSALIHRYYENYFDREKGREYAELYIAALYEAARAQGGES